VSDSVVSLDNNSIKLWDIRASTGSSIETVKMQGTAVCTQSIQVGQDVQRVMTGAWNPHSTDEVVTACESHLIGWDLRSSQYCHHLLLGCVFAHLWDTHRKTFSISKAHSANIRDIDFNPNRLYYFVSGGDDCLLKFWDQRNTAVPLKSLDGHSHWCWPFFFSTCVEHSQWEGEGCGRWNTTKPKTSFCSVRPLTVLWCCGKSSHFAF
jgi:WD40 repeat protein